MHKMSLRTLVANVQLTTKIQSIIGRRCFTSKSVDELLETTEEEPVFLEKTSDIEHKRNKSRLTTAHRNMLFGRKPHDEPYMWFHQTVKYKRRMLGRYGMEAVGAPAGLSWPTREEVEDAKEYERVAYPLTIQESWQKFKEDRKMREEATMARQNAIEEKMYNMNDLIVSVRQRIAKRQAELEEAKQKKERRLKEIRRELSAQGIVTNEKIEMMLEKYEKEDKKKKKQAKKQKLLERQQKLLEKIKLMEQPEAEKVTETSSQNKEASPEVEEPKK
ncbi:PREDICTED: putative golgin subfamily A member 6-like protein 3 [Dufourea novaeangliae]|uniref:Large ribosomal subunit protein mL64 n=1 Tax=Dufourea novaeangliae TaxID=178035 RepID=A0A154PC67_DUFNO|nr:PREDICTED: putative golgin subfamily A member 6-like protein 3 [Dufourea novaeangliae]KZC08868.1 hypothetical protein WN55_11371 [Dufourea novaeangliae]